VYGPLLVRAHYGTSLLVRVTTCEGTHGVRNSLGSLHVMCVNWTADVYGHIVVYAYFSQCRHIT